MKNTVIYIFIFILLGCTEKKSTSLHKPYYYYEEIGAFNEAIKDTSKNLIILFDSYGSSTRKSYSGWLESDSVQTFLKPNYSVFIFNIENLAKNNPAYKPSFTILKHFYSGTDYPYLLFLNKERNMIEIPKEYYFDTKNENEILQFLKSPGKKL